MQKPAKSVHSLIAYVDGINYLRCHIATITTDIVANKAQNQFYSSLSENQYFVAGRTACYGLYPS